MSPSSHLTVYVYLYVCLSVDPVDRSVYPMSIRLLFMFYLSIYLCIYLSTDLSIYLSPGERFYLAPTQLSTYHTAPHGMFEAPTFRA